MIIVCTPHFYGQSVTPNVVNVEEMMCVTISLVTVLMDVNIIEPDVTVSRWYLADRYP